MVLLAIFSSLVMGRPLQFMLRDQNVQAVFFVLGMLLVVMTITIHGIKVKPAKTELAVWSGMIAVYVILIFRLGAPERSHLIEYSVLAILIHKALIERRKEKEQILVPGLIAFLVTTLTGILDESLQWFLPNRTYDPQDMFFNGMAAFMAIGGSLIIYWVRRKFQKAE